MTTTIIHKEILASGRPYTTRSADSYIEYLIANRDPIYTGDVGIYLARRVLLDGQTLYFPFIDVDKDRNLNDENEKISSAILNATLCHRVLKELKADSYFQFIATGGSGFRIISNILLNVEAYKAFIKFVKMDLRHIWDTKPTEEMEMPHQLFAYKGSRYQSNKDLVDRHSAVVPDEVLGSGVIDVEYYKELTGGHPDPDEIVGFMKRFFDFRPIADLASLGEFGKRLIEYQKILDQIEINPFDYVQFCRSKRSLSLNALHQMLSEKGILCKIEKRGLKEAISFSGLPCPLCGKTTSNARAYPPHYSLKCFNMNCSASQGMFLMNWSGINGGTLAHTGKIRAASLLELPSAYEKIEDTEEIIKRELLNPEDVLLLLTPGVGKTHVALRCLSEIADKKTILYSCFNKKLQSEAYEKIRSFMGSRDHVHLLRSREELCRKTKQLNDVTSRGFSPSEFLCSSCEYRSDCEYYTQRDHIGSGIYFVTHHMLQYLESLFLAPDLIVLDENLVSGFLLEDTCSDLDMTTLSTILDPQDYSLVNGIIDIARRISLKIVKDEGSHALFINGARRASTDEHDSILCILAKEYNVEEEKITNRITEIISRINDTVRSKFYRSNVNGKAIEWLKGLVRTNRYSYALISQKGNISFNLKYLTPMGYKNTPIKILDATGNRKIAEALTDRSIRVIRADVEWSSRRIHVQTNTSRGVLKYASDKDLKRLLERVLKEVSAKKVMLVTYKFLKERMLRLCHDIDPHREYMAYHFNGPRGVNDYEECDGVIVLGLPYSNLNSSWQDANILLPNAEDADLRESWVESFMYWELVQDIHRIRPVRKEMVEIAIICRFWPTVIKAPEKIIDLSQSEHWKELAIKRLEPYVREFGFLNPDIGFLANVYIKPKLTVAAVFQERISDVMNAYFAAKGIGDTQFKYSLLSPWEEKRIDCRNRPTDTNYLDRTRCKLINVIYNIYYRNLLRRSNLLFQKIFDVSQKVDPTSTNQSLILSNNQQWAVLLGYFKEKYPHYESFEIRLPHARNNYVTGVGLRERVHEFYDQLTDLEIFGKIDTGSYISKQDNTITLEPLAEGNIVIYVPEHNVDMLLTQYGEKLTQVTTQEGLRALRTLLADKPGMRVISNNAKYLAKSLLLAGCNDRFDLHDVSLNEKLIRNGEALPKTITLDHLYNHYGLPQDPDINSIPSQIYEVWEKQNQLIDAMDLTNIAEMERRILRIAARIEINGISMNVIGALEMGKQLRDEKERLQAELKSSLPEHISLNKTDDLKVYLNETYKLDLTSTDKESLSVLKDDAAKELADLILHYRKISKQLSDLNRYLSFVDNDDRFHDRIDQLATVTGRFSAVLHSVPKGPMRSLFEAKEGYQFIVADYSQQEARIIAGLANDERSISVFNGEGDIYMDVAVRITGKPAEECRDFRRISKAIVLGLNYGRSEYSIYEELHQSGMPISLDDVRMFRDKYYQSYPNLFAWRNRIVHESRAKGFTQTPLGRRMKVLENTKETSLYNFPVQATGSDGFKLALIYLDRDLKDKDARIVHIMHDEIIVEARSDIAKEVAKITEDCMKRSFKKLIPSVNFTVMPLIRSNWG